MTEEEAASVDETTPGCSSTTCGASDECCPPGCAAPADADCPLCDPSIGLVAPIAPCAPENPCTSLLGTYRLRGISKLDTPIQKPACRTSDTARKKKGRPAFDDGEPGQLTDADGTPRYFCRAAPVGTAASAKRPLVIYVTGSGGSAADVYGATSLRVKAETFVLSGDETRPGFMLVSLQGRNLHWPTASAQDGTKHDTFHRDLGVPSTNRDVAFVDALIDHLVAQGTVDPGRIYLMGWSNGARFAALYGIGRHDQPTAGGNRVAAVAVYSGGDPYANIRHDQVPSCAQSPTPTTSLPLMLVSRNCDQVACSAEQDEAFRKAGEETAPGNVAGAWIDTLKNAMKDPNVTWLLLKNGGEQAKVCAPALLCGINLALVNHLHWPDGVDDSGGVDHEPEMLAFLRDHPLP